MARPKRYDDEYLLSCVDSYWTEYCHQNPDRITYKSLEAYLAGSNKADLPSDTLKHNRKVHEKIESLRAAARPDLVSIHSEDISTSERIGFCQEEYQHLAETNEKLRSFISRTYIHGICCHLVSEEMQFTLVFPIFPHYRWSVFESPGVFPIFPLIDDDTSMIINTTGSGTITFRIIRIIRNVIVPDPTVIHPSVPQGHHSEGKSIFVLFQNEHTRFPA